jgi:putative flippase GtrA
LIAALSSNVGDPSESGRIADLLATVLSDQELRQQKRSELLDFTIDRLGLPDAQVIAHSEGIITDAFLNHFWATADALSQDEMREVFARILAREIRSPGSFSASTLNLLTTLHPQIAMKFSLLCAMTFAFNGLVFVVVAMPHADGPNTIAHILGTSRKIGEQLTDFGLTREDLLDLRSAGLIRSLPEEEYPDLSAFFEASSVDFGGALATFEVGPAARERAGLAIVGSTNVISFTRAGTELRSILQLSPDPQYAEALKALMLGAGVRFSCVEPSD